MVVPSPGRVCLGQTPSATLVPRAGPRRVSEGAGGRPGTLPSVHPPNPTPGQGPPGL